MNFGEMAEKGGRMILKEKLLTENCKFVCDQSMPVPYPRKLQIINDNNVYYDNGQKVLTENSILIGNFGSCRLLPDLVKHMPIGGQCTFCSQPWSGAYEGVVIKNVKALSEKSSMKCPFGGIISPVIFGVKTSVNNVISNEYNLTKNALSAKEDKNFVNDGNKLSDNTGKTVNSAANKHNTSTEETETNSPEYKYALCNYQSCPDKGSCEYLKMRYDADSIDNDASKLERNYKNAYSTEYLQFIEVFTEKNSESNEGNWTYAAHHIISGKQIFAKHPYLVKLANYYQYDINIAQNCILLPSIHSFDGKTGVVKQANGYVAMDLMKMQWHVGSHDYSLDNDTIRAIYQYIKKNEHCQVIFYKNYMEAVEHEINILESKYLRSTCRKSNYREKRIRFINNMNNISKKIGNKIRAFEATYKHSYPYYVSKESCMFAFNVPNKKKFIIIYRQEKYKKISFVAVKMTVTRYKKDDYQIFFSANNPFAITDAESFIRFAENFKYFLILTPEYVLPWKDDRAREYILYDTMDCNDISVYCDEHKQKIISFIEARDGGEMYYESATKIVRQRMSDMGRVQNE